MFLLFLLLFLLLRPLFSSSSCSPFFCLVLSLFLSYPFLLLAHTPDLFSPLNLHFLNGMLLCVALVFIVFERLGDEYFSW